MALRFVGGNDVIEPFLLTATDGSIVDLTTMRPLTGGVWWRSLERFPLTIGAGLRIDNETPPLAGSGETQVPHGVAILTSAQTSDMPFGVVANIRIDARSLVEGLLMSTYFALLERIP